MNRIAAARITGAALLSNGLTATVSVPAAAASAPVSVDTSTNGVVISPDVASAGQCDSGLSPARAMVTFAQQDRADAQVATLRTVLGPIFAGSWLDAAPGEAVNAVTEVTAVSHAHVAAAEARVVTRTDVQLTAVAAGLRPKRASGGVVDLPTDQAAMPTVAQWSAARAETVTERPRPWCAVRGGEAWRGSNFRCSVGFGAPAAPGRRHSATAGPRTAGGGTASGYNRVSLGRINGSRFGSGGSADCAADGTTGFSPVNPEPSTYRLRLVTS
jgi:streptogrisin C